MRTARPDRPAIAPARPLQNAHPIWSAWWSQPDTIRVIVEAQETQLPPSTIGLIGAASRSRTGMRAHIGATRASGPASGHTMAEIRRSEGWSP